MTSRLGSLEVELLSAILEYVDDECPKTTKAVCLVNKHFYATAQTISYRRKTLDFTYGDISLPNHDREQVEALIHHQKLDETRDIIGAWLQNPTALRSIHHLNITGYQACRGRVFDRISLMWTPLTRLIEHLGRLKSLSWNYAGVIPLIVLNAIHQHHPKAELKVYSFRRHATDLDHNDPAELALAHSPALTVFKAVIWRTPGSPKIDFREAACRRIIANAPNLKHASVTTDLAGGVVGEQQVERDNQVKLFYTHKCPNESVTFLTLDGYGFSKHTLDEWGQFLSFSRLEGLKCSRGLPAKSYFSCAPDLLKKLRHLSLNFAFCSDPDIGTAAENYLKTCAPLETLSLWSWMNFISLTSILSHGLTLRTLQLHERESTDVDLPRGLLQVDDVRDIRLRCPKLQDFTMDIDRETEGWQDEVENPKIYQELALFGPQLNKIQLYFNLGIAAQIENEHGRHQALASEAAQEDDQQAAGVSSETDTHSANGGLSPSNKRLKQARLSARDRAYLPLPEPECTSDHVRFIWKTIFGRRTTGDRALDIKYGEWERKSGRGYPAPWIRWERSARSYIMLRPHERDDKRDEVIVRCVGALKDRI